MGWVGIVRLHELGTMDQFTVLPLILTPDPVRPRPSQSEAPCLSLGHTLTSHDIISSIFLFICRTKIMQNVQALNLRHKIAATGR